MAFRTVCFRIDNETDFELRFEKKHADDGGDLQDPPKTIPPHTTSARFKATSEPNRPIGCKGSFTYKLSVSGETIHAHFEYNHPAGPQTSSYTTSTSPPDELCFSIKPPHPTGDPQNTIFTVRQMGKLLTNASWMGDASKILCDRNIRDIALPGAHDAASYGITVHSEVSSDNKILKDAYKMAEKLGFGGTISELAAPWSKAQSVSTYVQLLAGVRYFDLRVDNKEGAIWTCHGLFSVPVDDPINDVARFCERYEREVVLLDFQHLYLTDEQERELAQKVTDKLGPRLLEAPQSGHLMTYGDILNGSPRVVVLWGGKETPEGFWQRSSWVRSNWFDDQRGECLKKHLDAEIQKAQADRDKFFVLQSVLTANVKMVAESFLKHHPQSLYELATGVTNDIYVWCATDWKSAGLNIIMVDFFESTKVMKAVRILNDIPHD